MKQPICSVWLKLAAFSLAQAWLAHAAEVTVEIVNRSFQPATVTINVGDTVTWVNRDSLQHNSVSDTALWRGPLLFRGETFPRTFETAGEFPYHCEPHPDMRGTVIVQAAANQPPVVTISSPANNSTFTAPADVTIVAAASDPDGVVTRVEFFSGRASLGSASSSPFQITTRLEPGTYNVTAQATDNDGATASSPVVALVVSEVPSALTVSITAPNEAATFSAPAELVIEAAVEGAASQVEFLLNNASVGTAMAPPYSVTVTNLAAGEYTLTARATGAPGQSAMSAPVRITVQGASAAFSLSGPSRTPDGKFEFVLHGSQGRTYTVQASSDLNTWETIQTVTAASDIVTISDTPPQSLAQRMYRVQVQP